MLAIKNPSNNSLENINKIGNTNISNIGDGTVTGAISELNNALGETNNTLEWVSKASLRGTEVDGITSYPVDCGVYRVTDKRVPGLPDNANLFGTLIIYGSGYYTHIYRDCNGRTFIASTDFIEIPPSKWDELVLGGNVIETKVVPVPYLDGATYHTIITLNKTFNTNDMAIFFTPVGNYNMSQFTIAVEAISGNQVAIYGRANYGVTFPSGTVLYGSLMVVGKTV